MGPPIQLFVYFYAEQTREEHFQVSFHSPLC